MRTVAVVALLLVAAIACLPAVQAATSETWTDGIYDLESGVPQGALQPDVTIDSASLVRVPYPDTVVGTVPIAEDPLPPRAPSATLPARAPPAG